MSPLRRTGSVVAVLAITLVVTRMMQNPTMWGLLEQPVVSPLMELLGLRGQEGADEAYVYVTLALSLLFAVPLVMAFNRLVKRRPPS